MVLLLAACSSAPTEAPAPPADPLQARLQAALEARGPDYEPRAEHVDAQGRPEFTNRLILESSPYLLQHAHNPVNWSPWGEEAFARARDEDKPIFLSIGYSTCHWCHVMEHESFEDLEIAAYINEHFVPIKVDREERPDIDAVYSAATRALTGRSGWPMTLLLTPDKKPFFAGTYFPARTGDRGKREGLESILHRLHEEWTTKRDSLAANATQLSHRLAHPPAAQAAQAADAAAFLAGTRAIASGYDPEFGGFGGSKKFPRPSSLRLLLRYHRRTGDPLALKIVTHTLRAMADGGIHDAVGGGFHRYTVDRRWQVPHFEKMLYDNAQLAGLYADAWQITGEPRFQRVVETTLRYLMEGMSQPEGGFYSATDADSPGPDGERHEGLYFTWTPGELRDALPPDLLPIAVSLWGVTARGNFEGRSILHRARPRDELAADRGVTPVALLASVDDIEARLRDVRSQRPPPLRDDKVLCAWNGLTIGAFARAGRIFDRRDWVQRAARGADFALKTLRVRGRLHRSWTEGVLGPAAFLDDYALLIAGLLDLFEADGNPRWLAAAQDLDRELQLRFAAPEGGWNRSADDAERLLRQERPHRDGVLPSGNGVQVLNLLRLGAWTTSPAYRARAETALASFGGDLRRRPSSSPSLLAALDWLSDDPMEVVVVGGGPLEGVLARSWNPNAVTWTGAPSPAVPWLEGKGEQGGEPTAYVCHEGLCKAPTHDPAGFAALLAEVPPLSAPPLPPPHSPSRRGTRRRAPVRKR